MEELLVFIALSLLKFKGIYYKAKMPVFMTDEQSAPYISAGLLRLATEGDVDVKHSADVSNVDPSDVRAASLAVDSMKVIEGLTALGDEAKQIALLEAIAELDPENGEHYTATGKPKTDALSELVGREVSASERDFAFAEFTTKSTPE